LGFYNPASTDQALRSPDLVSRFPLKALVFWGFIIPSEPAKRAQRETFGKEKPRNLHL
tara:strand:- start:87 stop:260 length:174 start_codon:yes stop_codon:yes gene_type:complete